MKYSSEPSGSRRVSAAEMLTAFAGLARAIVLGVSAKVFAFGTRMNYAMPA